MRGFETYHSAKKKLLDNASNALKYINTTSQQGRRRPREEDEDLSMNPPPAKRAFPPTTNMSQCSPNVQVSNINHRY